jgi:hypothetical protein
MVPDWGFSAISTRTTPPDKWFSLSVVSKPPSAGPPFGSVSTEEVLQSGATGPRVETGDRGHGSCALTTTAGRIAT